MTIIMIPQKLHTVLKSLVILLSQSISSSHPQCTQKAASLPPSPPSAHPGQYGSSVRRVVLKLLPVPVVALPGAEREAAQHVGHHQPPRGAEVTARQTPQHGRVDQHLCQEVGARDQLKPVAVWPAVSATATVATPLPLPLAASPSAPCPEAGQDLVTDVLVVTGPQEEAECCKVVPADKVPHTRHRERTRIWKKSCRKKNLSMYYNPTILTV